MLCEGAGGVGCKMVHVSTGGYAYICVGEGGGNVSILAVCGRKVQSISGG